MRLFVLSTEPLFQPRSLVALITDQEHKMENWDQAKGFVVLPKRWIVERTLTWLNRCRRLTRIGRTSIAQRSRFCALPQSGLMLRKLCNPH